MKPRTVVYPARRIITQFPEQPFAGAVAVMDGRILAVGEPDEITGALKNSPFTPFTVDNTFENKVLIPGLIDAHTHVELQALIYSGHFVAQIPWPRPEGGFFPVTRSKVEVLERLKQLDRELPPGELLLAVAYDENKAGGYLHLRELDTVSATRPILVTNLVFHRFWANSFLLQKAGISENHLPAGVLADPDGKPNGMLVESRGLIHLLPALPGLVDITADKLRRVLPLFTAAGNTTVCEASLGALGLEKAVGTCHRLLASPEARLRVVGLPWAASGAAQCGSLDAFIDWVKQAREKSTDKFRIGAVKLYTDGSIVSRTSPIGWPGYWDGSPEGHWAAAPEEIRALITRLHAEGLSTVTHCNSQPACQVVLDAVKEAQHRCYRADMRHRIDHAYNITEAQLRLARELGVAVQFFSTQIYYYGDNHLGLQGPDRAMHMTPIGTARRLGVSWGFHNDPPGTPQLPWTAAWTAVHRLSADSGRVLGPGHRVTVAEALSAMTIEAAFQIHLDAEIGSIAFGKKADFCVLEADPLEIDPMALKDIPVWGTVFGGELNPAR